MMEKKQMYVLNLMQTKAIGLRWTPDLTTYNWLTTFSGIICADNDGNNLLTVSEVCVKSQENRHVGLL